MHLTPEDRDNANSSRCPSGSGERALWEDAELILPESLVRRWKLQHGTRLSIQETADGVLLRPADRPLRKLYVEPTSSCNLHCRTCMRNSWTEPVGSMDITLFRQLVEDLREVPSLSTMAFWGIGEPLLHPHIVEMVSLAKGLGVTRELVTNGLLLDRVLAEALVEVGLDTLVLSVDGASPQAYSDIRADGDLRLLQENVKALIGMRRARRRMTPKVGIEFVLMRRNVSELEKLPHLAFMLGASFVVVTNLLPYTEELQEEILYWMSAGAGYSRIRTNGLPEFVLPRVDLRSEYAGPLLKLLWSTGASNFEQTGYAGSTGRCPFIWEGSAAITWEGDVSPCVALMHSHTCYVLGREKFIRRHAFGNVGRERMTQIWENNQYAKFRSRVLDFDFSPCISCGGCDHSVSNEQDCFGNEHPVCGDCLWATGVVLCP